MNEGFIYELDKIGLHMIDNRGTYWQTFGAFRSKNLKSKSF